MDKSTFRYGKIDEMSDKPDIIYWQTRTDLEKFTEAWRLVKVACEIKGIKEDELRLQRSIASFKRQTS